MVSWGGRLLNKDITLKTEGGNFGNSYWKNFILIKRKPVLLCSLYQLKVFDYCMHYQSICKHNDMTSLMTFVSIVSFFACLLWLLFPMQWIQLVKLRILVLHQIKSVCEGFNLFPFCVRCDLGYFRSYLSYWYVFLLVVVCSELLSWSHVEFFKFII